MNSNKTRIFLILLTAIWIWGFIHPVIFPDSSLTILLNPFLNKFYSTICHQETHKLCSVNSHFSYLCFRCTGIYTGLFAGILLSFFIIKALKLKSLILATLILLSDVIASTLGIYTYNGNLAFLTGLFFGIILFLYIQDMILKVFTKRN